MDHTDLTLLDELQRDASRSHRDLGERVGLSAGAVHKRLARLRRDGYLRGIRGELDRDKVGLDLLCFLHVQFKSNMLPHNMVQLMEALAAIPEVLECYTTTGANDAIAKAVVRDHEALKDLLKQIAESQEVIERVYTSIALQEIKNAPQLPLSRSDLARGATTESP